MKSLALLSLLSIVCTGLTGCWYHDDDRDHHHDHAARDYRDGDHVVREERTVVVPEHQTEVHIDR